MTPDAYTEYVRDFNRRLDEADWLDAHQTTAEQLEIDSAEMQLDQQKQDEP